MAKRTIIALEQGIDNKIFVKLLRAPMPIADAEVLHEFKLSPPQMPPWTDADAVRKYGAAIHQALSEHAAVNEALHDALQTMPGETHSLFFYLNAATAEQLYWEALFDEQGKFLALDDRWPIGRMADPVVELATGNVEFTPPLRIMAWLSARGFTSANEWAQLAQALAQARSQGLAVELAIYVGEEQLLGDIRTQINAGALPQAKVDFIKTQGELEQAIANFSPHILHVFCHGRVDLGFSGIELATRFMELDPDNAQPLLISVETLANLLVSQHVWLVTLNCCKGASSSDQLHSMARRLVAGGVPAVVGMLESIDLLDANAFCGGFYQKLFALLQEVFAQPGGGQSEIRWERALHSARQCVVDKNGGDATNQRFWTLPALYVRMEPFRLLLSSAAPSSNGVTGPKSLINQIQEVAAFLRMLPADAPDAVRLRVLALLDNVPAAMRPNKSGTFV